LLVCLDYLPTQAAARAHVLFPTSTHFETGSHFINQEARLQYAEAVHASSRPLSQVTAGKHPPRDYGWHGDAPGPQPAWQVLQDLCDRVTGQKEQADIQALLQQLHPGCSEQAGLLLQKEAGAAYHFPVPASREAAREPGAMELILTAWTFGTEELSSYSAPAAGVKSEPHVMMHVEDAARGGLNDGDMVILHLDRGILQLRLQTSAGMARGCVVLPRHRDLEWQQLKYQQGMLPLCRIERA
jgi:anaerobic selenocysteine-containing dehydrogenase